MSTRSLLISYAGYPFTPSSLMPDNGLANLAGALIREGNDAMILDYGTVDTIKRLYPPSIAVKASPIYEKLFRGGGGRRNLLDLISIKRLSHRLEKHQDRELIRIADELISEIKHFKPDFIGFKLWNGDGFTGTIKLAEMTKRAFPRLKIFAGGPHVDIFKKHIFSATDVFDALVYGEGEEVINRLCDYCRGRIALDEIPNLIYKRENRVLMSDVKWIENLDSLPYPVYDDEIYPSMRGNQKIKIIVLDESRGCPYGCAFCIQPVKSGKKLRLKSPERVVDEIKRIIGRYAITCFRYAGSTTPIKHAVNIARRILDEKLNITYSTFGHIQETGCSDFKILKKSGCYAIFFGIESGSRRILHEGFGKRIEPELIRRALKDCRNSGIFTVGSMIFPGPFETEETEKESLELLLDARPDSVPVQFPGIIPETEWRLRPEKFNFSMNREDYESAIMNYKIKFLYPPAYWMPLPYRVNNRPYKKFAKETDDFARILENAGISTNFTDDQALMALHAGYRGKEREFRQRLRFSHAAGEIGFIEELVNSINSAVVRNA